MPSISRLESALQRARRPSAVVAENYYSDPPTQVSHVNSQLDGPGALLVLDYLFKANALRDQIQRQVARAVGVLAAPENLNWPRLAGKSRGAVPKKPRILLWAEFNCRDTLEILAFPHLDSSPSNGCVTREVLTAHSDYVELRSLSPTYAARNAVVFRALAAEYVDRERREKSRQSRRDGEDILRDALEDSLTYLVTTLASVCDVCVGNWPEYTDTGRLDLLSPSDRAYKDVSKQLPELKQRRRNLEALINEKVRKHKLASVTEFGDLVAQASRDGVKVTALIFEKTGQRCSSIGTDKISELLVEYHKVVMEVVEFDAVLAELRRGTCLG